LQSLPATALHALPCVFCIWHAPVASQYSPLAQSLSETQPVGQVVPPLQTSGAHDGLPGKPAAAGVHVPDVHTSH
jgi:hypothetical protein